MFSLMGGEWGEWGYIIVTRCGVLTLPEHLSGGDWVVLTREIREERGLNGGIWVTVHTPLKEHFSRMYIGMNKRT